ncbi:MAG: hypothetical protein K2I04_04530 [Muribaculaceae bacterium]|nr:hypothetical protein [Muribaculaceae bacterium]
MTDIKEIIRLNIELEGMLRVLDNRDSEQAREILAERFRTYSLLMENLLGAQPAENVEETIIKEQEAEDAEIPTQNELAAQAIADETAEVEPKYEPEPAPAPAPVHTAPRPNTVLKAFTLNDKFRFIREVFGGNESDFNDTLALIAAMESYGEAADYVFNDMMLDADNPDVADFMAVVKRNMPL